MTEVVVVVQETTPIVQVTDPAAGVVEIDENDHVVEVANDCDVVVVQDAPTEVVISDDTESVETSVIDVVVEVNEFNKEVVSVGEQGPTAEDNVKLQEISDTDITDPGLVTEVTTIYKGEAQPGVTPSQSLWRIRRIVFNSGAGADDCAHSITWADQVNTFTKVWEATPGDELYKTYDYTP